MPKRTAAAADIKEEEEPSAVVLFEKPVIASAALKQYDRVVPAKNLFRYVTTQAEHFATLFGALKLMFKTMRLVVSAEGMTGTCIDTARTCIARYSFSASDMTDGVFRAPAAPIEAVFGVDEISDLLGAIHQSDSICFYFDDDTGPTKLYIASVEEETNGLGCVGLLVVDEITEVPPVQYSSRIILEADAFTRRLNSRTNARSVVFRIDDDNRFTIELSSTLGTMISFSWPLENDEDNRIDLTRVSRRDSYKLAMLVAMGRVSKSAKFVDIALSELAHDVDGDRWLPMCLTYQLSVIGSVTFFLSPLYQPDES